MVSGRCVAGWKRWCLVKLKIGVCKKSGDRRSVNLIEKYRLLGLEYSDPKAQGTFYINVKGFKLGLLGLSFLIPITE